MRGTDPPRTSRGPHERPDLALRYRRSALHLRAHRERGLDWLVAFNVVNVRNPVVAQIGEVLYRITEPALRPIRNLLPNLGGVDISPIILILLLLFISRLLHEFAVPATYVYTR